MSDFTIPFKGYQLGITILSYEPGTKTACPAETCYPSEPAEVEYDVDATGLLETILTTDYAQEITNLVFAEIENQQKSNADELASEREYLNG